MLTDKRLTEMGYVADGWEAYVNGGNTLKHIVYECPDEIKSLHSELARFKKGLPDRAYLASASLELEKIGFSTVSSWLESIFARGEK